MRYKLPTRKGDEEAPHIISGMRLYIKSALSKIQFVRATQGIFGCIERLKGLFGNTQGRY